MIFLQKIEGVMLAYLTKCLALKFKTLNIELLPYFSKSKVSSLAGLVM